MKGKEWGRGGKGGDTPDFLPGLTRLADPHFSRRSEVYVLIHPTVWPQYTNVTDRQWSDSIGRAVLQRLPKN